MLKHAVSVYAQSLPVWHGLRSGRHREYQREERTSAASMRRLWSSTDFFGFSLSQEVFLFFAFRGSSLLDGRFISDFYPHSE
jgi:hypothetical protein